MWCHHRGSSHQCKWISDLYFKGLEVKTKDEKRETEKRWKTANGGIRTHSLLAVRRLLCHRALIHLQHLEATAAPDIQSRPSTSDLLAMLVRCCIDIHGIYGSGHPRTSHLEYPSVTSTCDRIVEKRRIIWNFNFLFCAHCGQKLQKS